MPEKVNFKNLIVLKHRVKLRGTYYCCPVTQSSENG